MAQAELTPTITIKPTAVPRYVKAICAVTGRPEPEGEVTQPQMHVLIRAIMNYAVERHEQETTMIVPPEGIGA